ncbi:MAG TPA: DUF86 domain-containing protein [Methanofastidiosum sp.]|nr:DUF86 domain-containing protein [Methanofastidiosum sp.]HPA49080.1 DUF86 domain-containing protein [Methanofastidiosum sp.]HQK62896.1 DUF86 domain-containing protein [Methanofastidiosum sp.]HQQ49261.1 DUF86 domain-containing protein [Methanofastidiosum sp.]
MKESQEIYLRHILDAINNIEKYTKNLDYSKFQKNSMAYHAVIYQILVIGEAVKNLSDETKDDYPDVPWRNIAGTRDRLIHGYFEIQLKEIWKVVTDDLNDLKQVILAILED